MAEKETITANEPLVEIYYIEDFIGGPQETHTEAQKNLCELLGLTGQLKVKKEEGNIPFQRLSPEEFRIWQAFCPGDHKLETYDEGIIPTRVLETIKTAKDAEHFKHYRVWTETEHNPDPVVVGFAKGDYDWCLSPSDGCYLIARWGPSLTDWQDIVRLAREKYAAKAKAQLVSMVAEGKKRLESLDQLVLDYFAGRKSDDSVLNLKP